MGDEIETSEAPQWLTDLEAKRERRLKARLGHETGAGAPCLTCEQKCPGLDLHFWRKICKNCKCSKEDHDVPDDDIYGWAQVELLGTKPNKIKRKIILPGRKDAVELEWSPKGQSETVEDFLKTLPPEMLPVKGSQAAQDRKQMLQKQIPIHDIDPTLCHDLTEAEMKMMQEYIAHMKKNSVGVGQIIQVAAQRGNLHFLGSAEAKVLKERYPKGIPASELVTLQGQSAAGALSKKMSDLAVRENLGAGKSAFNIQSEEKQPCKMGSIRDVSYPIYQNENTSFKGDEGINDRDYERNSISKERNTPYMHENVPRNIYRTVNDLNREPINSVIKDLNYATLHNPTERILGRSDFPNNIPSLGVHPSECQRIPVSSNLKDLQYQSYSHDNKGATSGLPNFSPNNKTIEESLLNPVKNPYKTEQYPQYSPNDSVNANLEPGGDNLVSINKDPKALPHYASGTFNIYKDHQSPQKIGNLKDLVYSTYDPKEIGTLNDFENSNRGSFKEQIPQVPANQYYDDHSAIRTILKQKYGDYNQNKLNNDNLYADLDFDQKNVKESSRNPSALPNYQPNALNVTESELNPEFVNIPPINDIIYDLPEIKTAENLENPFNEAYLPPQPIFESDDLETFPSCHRCQKQFMQKEFAVQVEQNNSLFHPECLRCAGCNQILADMFYFYDKKSDDVYCGRDYAKIRGIPRCKACDELIFVKEYTLAENSTFHIKHFCCFECDEPLAGKNYVVEDSQPVCLPCYEKLKADWCRGCGNIIKPDEQGANLNGTHFHANDACFACKVCRKPLLGSKLMFRNEKLFCSVSCFKTDQEQVV